MALEQVLHQRNLSSDTDRLPSPAIWGDCPVLGLMAGTVNGVYFFDDYTTSYDVATNETTVLKYGPYEIYTGNGTNLLGSGGLTGVGGHQVWASGDTADVNGVMTLGGGAPFMISDTAGDDHKLWFECRFKVSSVTTADQVAFFFGLSEEDRAAANGVFAAGGGDLGVTTTIDLLGFGRFDDDGDSLSFFYQKASQTAQDKVQIALAADTYIKVGFVYDPKGPSSKKIKVFANNSEQATAGASATDIAAATFPDGEELTYTFSFHNDSTTSNTITIDWVRIAQVYSGF
jgi:hypothetical protein